MSWAGALLVAKCETKRKLAGEEVGGKLRSVDAVVAHRRQGRREVALGETPPVLVSDEPMMEIGRLG